MLIWNNAAVGYRIDSIDLAPGVTTPVVDIQPMLGNLRLGKIFDLSVDAEKQRVLLAASGRDGAYPERWLVIAVDLVTQEQSVIYDGSPAADGSKLTCAPVAAFDSRRRRVLLIEPHPSYQDPACPDGIFAVDADTGEFTRLSGGANP